MTRYTFIFVLAFSIGRRPSTPPLTMGIVPQKHVGRNRPRSDRPTCSSTKLLTSRGAAARLLPLGLFPPTQQTQSTQTQQSHRRWFRNSGATDGTMNTAIWPSHANIKITRADECEGAEKPVIVDERSCRILPESRPDTGGITWSITTSGSPGIQSGWNSISWCATSIPGYPGLLGTDMNHSLS